MATSVVPIIHTLFEPTSGTWQYVVACPTKSQAVVIDPVLNFNAATNKLTTKSTDEILAIAKEKGYRMTHLLETHMHADHLTASHGSQQQLGDTADKRPKTCIADHVGYLTGENVFAGTRSSIPTSVPHAAVPRGLSNSTFNAMSKLSSLPRNYRVYTSDDYPPATRAGKPLPYTTVADQREGNRHVKDGTSQDEFVKWRSGRDAGLAEPKLISQALQFSIMAGHRPEVVADEHRYFAPRTPAQTVL